MNSTAVTPGPSAEHVEGAMVERQAHRVAVVTAIDPARDLPEIAPVGEPIETVTDPVPARDAEADIGLCREVGVAHEVEPESMASPDVVAAPRELDRPAPLVARPVADMRVAEREREAPVM